MKRTVSLLLFVIWLTPGKMVAIADNAEKERPTPREQAQILVQRGLALGGNSEEESTYYRRAVEIDPTYASAHFNLGFVYHSRGELENAIEPYRKCLLYDRKRYDAHRNLAVCLLEVRRDAALYEVRKHLNLAIELEEALPPGKRPSNLPEQRAELLGIEHRINAVLHPTIRERYSTEEIIEVLNRRVIRGGQGVYEGPRLPIFFFGTGRAKLTMKNETELRALAKALNSPDLVDNCFVIEGHADGRGSAFSNLELSRRRAEAVQNWLIQQGGIDPKRLFVEFYGEDRPIYPNDSPEHYRYNRRIEIVRRYAE